MGSFATLELVSIRILRRFRRGWHPASVIRLFPASLTPQETLQTRTIDGAVLGVQCSFSCFSAKGENDSEENLRATSQWASQGARFGSYTMCSSRSNLYLRHATQYTTKTPEEVGNSGRRMLLLFFGYTFRLDRPQSEEHVVDIWLRTSNVS